MPRWSGAARACSLWSPARGEKGYQSRVPWCNLNWGVDGENPDDPGQVQWLLIDRTLVTASRDRLLLDDLLHGEFGIVSEQDGLVVAHRVRPAQEPPGT